MKKVKEKLRKITEKKQGNLPSKFIFLGYNAINFRGSGSDEKVLNPGPAGQTSSVYGSDRIRSSSLVLILLFLCKVTFTAFILYH